MRAHRPSALLSLLSCSLVFLACRAPAAPDKAAPVPAPVAWAPFDLGAHHRPVSTTSRAAQLAFDQGLIWAYGFNHDEAIRAFNEAIRQDPGLAMAYWGIALVNGPNINNPLVDEVHAKAAWEALQEAKQRAGSASEVEHALIEALSARYAWPQPEDRKPLDEAYARAMAGVHQRFPGDADVAALYAEALMDTRPWDQWTDDGEPQPGTLETLNVLETALRLDPDHPGALHLLIHATEASPHPERAEAAADRLRSLVPDSSHLVHMPSHIDVRLGRWAEASRVNERAMAADARYAARQPDLGFYALYMAHNAHFLAYTAMMQGNSAVAIAQTDRVVRNLPLETVRENPLFFDAFLTVGLDARKRFGHWQEIVDAPAPPADLPVSTAYWHFVRGIAFSAMNRLDDAEKERALFHAALPKIPEDAFWGSNLAADVLHPAVPYLDGEIAYRRGDLGEAARQLEEAVRLEDALKYDEPPPWTTPSRHALGAVLLEDGKPEAAEAVYRADLVRYPENGWALWGLSRALAAEGHEAEAAEVRARFEKTWADADVPMVSSCLCVRPGEHGAGEN